MIAFLYVRGRIIHSILILAEYRLRRSISVPGSLENPSSTGKFWASEIFNRQKQTCAVILVVLPFYQPEKDIQLGSPTGSLSPGKPFLLVRWSFSGGTSSSRHLLSGHYLNKAL